MSKINQSRYSWRALHDLLLAKAAEMKPRFLPSGRLKSEEKIDYREVIETAAKSMIRFKKPERLIRMIVRVIAEQVKVSHTGVLLYREKKDSYELIDSKGAEGKRIPIGYVRIPANSPLVTLFVERKSFLLDEHDALIYDNLEHLLNNPALLRSEKGLKDKIIEIKREMKLLRAEVSIPAFFKKKLLGILILGKKVSGEKFDEEEIGFFATLASDAAMSIMNAQLIKDLQGKIKELAMMYEREHRLFMHALTSLAAAIDAKNPYTHGHTERVTYYSLMIADELKDNPEFQNRKNFREALRIASLLHDIGKIGIPDNILNKKKELTEREYGKIREHPEIGATILQPIRELGDIIDIVRAHQERYDGKGYPAGLKGQEIPFMSRIISVADSFDAITTVRPYRDNKTVEDGLKEIKKNSGTQFDPTIVDAFLRAYQKGKIYPVPNLEY